MNHLFVNTLVRAGACYKTALFSTLLNTNLPLNNLVFLLNGTVILFFSLLCGTLKCSILYFMEN